MRYKFDWDQGNHQKNFLKHGITNREIESIFDDPHKLVAEDLKHSESEMRYICIGRSEFERILYAAFTIRNGKYRVISCRPANKKNRGQYEKQ